MDPRTEPWPAGVPCWADLTVPDLNLVTPFYRAVLGWETEESTAEYAGYVLARVDGAPAAGLAPAQGETAAAWTLYLASDDVDATASAVVDAGGTVVLPPADVGPLGRMCIAADPTGAVFGVWQAGTHLGAAIVNAPGGLSWEDLRSSDPDAARAFYRSVFGYDAHPLEMAGPDYTVVTRAGGDRPLGGIGGMMGQDAARSHWLLYFGVADAAAAAEAATAHGGRVVTAVFDTPFGRMAALSDPAGATFMVVEQAGAAAG